VIKTLTSISHLKARYTQDLTLCIIVSLRPYVQKQNDSKSVKQNRYFCNIRSTLH